MAESVEVWGNGLKIARIEGFDIKIDASWVLIATIIVWSLSTGYFPEALPGASSGTLLAMAMIAMLGLFGSLILHELAHAVVARRYGLQIRGITLFLFGGVAELQSEPASGTSEFWIAIAGPVASLCIALALWFSAQLAHLTDLPEPAYLVLSYLAVINLVLALFNLLPAFPMDGGRVFRAWLWSRSGDLLAATRRATALSTGIAYGLIFLGLFTAFSGSLAAGLWPILIGFFLLAASRASLARLEAKIALDGRTVADLMTRDPWTAPPETSLSELVNRIFLAQGITFAPVVEDGVLLGYIDSQMVRKIDRENWGNTTVDDVFEAASDENSVPATLPGLDLLARMMATGRRKYLVRNEQSLVGVVTLSDLLVFLNVSKEMG